MRIARPGASIFYSTHGSAFDKDGKSMPCITFIHGAGGNCLTWWQNVPYFASTYFVILLEMRGWGRSNLLPLLDEEGNALDNESHIYYAGDVTAIWDLEKVGEAFLVGHSRGGVYLTRVAIEAPARVLSLFYSNTVMGFTDVRTLPSESQLVQDFFSQAWEADGGRKMEIALRMRASQPFLTEDATARVSLSYEERCAGYHNIFQVESKELAFLQRLIHLYNEQDINQMKSIIAKDIKSSSLCATDELRETYTGPVRFVTTHCDGAIFWEVVEYVAAKLGGDTSVHCLDSMTANHNPMFEVATEYNLMLDTLLRQVRESLR
jgi:pimeloyl-ACP methyl ester carboxylesterase